MILGGIERTGTFDCEAVEKKIMQSMHSLGSKVLEELLNADLIDDQAEPPVCEQGHVSTYIEYREKTILTVLGEIRFRRRYYYDAQCKHGCCPKDRTLDVEGSSFSAGVRRMMGYVGANHSFEKGQVVIEELTGLVVTAKAIERESRLLGREVETFLSKETKGCAEKYSKVSRRSHVTYVCMDGTGVPMVKKEPVGRKGKDGGAKTREAKLGCIFTQTTCDSEGHAIRDERSTKYVGAIENAEEFGKRLREEAGREDAFTSARLCVIGDGATWIWNLAEEHFPRSIQIIDLYHAREHYWDVARAMYSEQNPVLKQWTAKRKKELDSGNVEAVIRAIARLQPSTDDARKICSSEIHYFQKHKERMRYNVYRSKGLFVGSGVIEAGCRTIVAQRLKQSGMHWTVAGANSIIALRCCLLSNRWEDYWAYRAAA